jgi:hypothetical protein
VSDAPPLPPATLNEMSAASLRFTPSSNDTFVWAAEAASELEVLMVASIDKASSEDEDDAKPAKKRYLLAKTFIKYAMSTPSESPSRSGSIAASCSELRPAESTAPPM